MSESQAKELPFEVNLKLLLNVVGVFNVVCCLIGAKKDIGHGHERMMSVEDRGAKDNGC